MPLTKKELEKLNNAKATITPPKDVPQRYIVQMSLTKGELLALKHALDSYTSMVAGDVRAYVNNAIENAGIEF